MDVGVAEIDADSIAPVLINGPSETIGDEVESGAPGHLLPLPGPAVSANRPPETVGVGVQVGQSDAFGADVPAGQRIVGVAPDCCDDVVLDGQFESADRLAQVADADLLLRSLLRGRHVLIVARARHTNGNAVQALLRNPQ